MRRWLARTGLVLTLLIAGVYVASVWWWVGGMPRVAGRNFVTVVMSGCVLVADVGTTKNELGLQMDWGTYHRSEPMHWWFQHVKNPVVGDQLIIPLWAPLLLTAIPTFFLWPRPFRRPRPGHCRACGYDLKGVPTSTCPECGKGAA